MQSVGDGEARPPGIAKYMVTQSRVPGQNQISQSLLVELGLLGPQHMARPSPYSVTLESEVTVRSGEAGPSWSRASGVTSTSKMAADAKSAFEARPPGIAKHSARTEFGLAVSLDEARSIGSRAGGTIRVLEVHKVSRQESGEVVDERVRDVIVRFLDANRGSPSRVLEFIQETRERMRREFGTAGGEGFSSSSVVRD